ncbi:zinc finger matrin-type protein 1 [Polymixia lowei]
MDERSVCTLQLTESDAENNTVSTPNAASITDAHKVINTKISSAQNEGDLGEEELLKGLLTDDYCHVCEAVLLFESQRLSHYEGKKHTQKLRLYLQTKKAERMNKQPDGLQRGMTTDKDRFCELCNMVFGSPIVARSHYEGKVHAKNLRKQGLQPTGVLFPKGPDMPTLPAPTQASTNADQKSAREGATEPQNSTAATIPSTGVDLKDPNKYCALCAASFNNPQMALQHYNGRKHQRNHARQELIKDLGDNAQQANSLTCQMCNIQFNSVEMYQAHMQGNKHQTKEKKVIDLCKSQQKAYSSYADELADYIQVQKARGITPKAGHILPQGDGQKEGEKDQERGEDESMNKANSLQLNKHSPNLPPTSNPSLAPHAGCYYPAAAGWCPPYQCPPANLSFREMPYGWDNTFPPPALLQGTGSPHFPNWPTARQRHREQSSSSSSSYTSSSSSYSSSTSDSDNSEYRHRERKRKYRSERKRRPREEDSDSDDARRRKRRKAARDEDLEKRRGREEGAESEEERRRKRHKNHGKRRRQERAKRSCNEEEEEEEEGMGAKELKAEDTMEEGERTEVHMQAELTVEQGDRQQTKPSKPKHRKEKKKTKERVDTRTEEEKLWDESILGL